MYRQETEGQGWAGQQGERAEELGWREQDEDGELGETEEGGADMEEEVDGGGGVDLVEEIEELVSLLDSLSIASRSLPSRSGSA